jgi:hypothetical protein
MKSAIVLLGAAALVATGVAMAPADVNELKVTISGMS